MILILAVIVFALALGLKVQRVGIGVCLAIGLFSLLASTVFLYAYFRLLG